MISMVIYTLIYRRQRAGRCASPVADSSRGSDLEARGSSSRNVPDGVPAATSPGFSQAYNAASKR